MSNESINCQTARLLLSDLTSDDTTLRQALEHIVTCANCAHHIEQLQQLLFANQQAMSLSENQIFDLLMTIEDDGLPELTTIPEFDFSFLTRKPTWWEKLTEKVQQFTSTITVEVTAQLAMFNDLPATLQVAPVSGDSFRAVVGHSNNQVLVLPTTDANVSIQLVVGPVVEQRAAITIKLHDTPTNAPCANMSVRLYDDKRQLLSILTTSGDGDAVFRDVVMGRYIVQVRLQESQWEVPLLLKNRT